MNKLFFLALWFLVAGVSVGARGGVLPFTLPEHGAVAPFQSADYPTGVFIVEAFFKNCHWCNVNAVNVNELAADFLNNPRVKFLDVGVDRDEDSYDAWIYDNRPNHPVLKDKTRSLIKKLGTSAYPSTYVIDGRNGNVVLKTTGAWGMTEKVTIRGTVQRLLNSNAE